MTDVLAGIGAIDWSKWLPRGGAALLLVVLPYAFVRVRALLAARKAAFPPAPKLPAAPAAPSAPPAPGTSIADIWTRFISALPPPMRAAPVTIVLGERLAGKTALIKACVDPARQQVFSLASATDDPRLQLYPGGDQIVQEIGGELIGPDAPPETRSQLVDLFRRTGAGASSWPSRLTAWWPAAHAWVVGLSGSPAPRVVVVVDTKSETWTPEKLATLGARFRACIDAVTEARGAPPRVRVCLTHLDETDGFQRFAAVLREVGERAHVAPAGLRPVDLGRGLEPMAAHLAAAIAASPEAGAFEPFVGFLHDGGPKLLRESAPLLASLLASGPRSGSWSVPPRLDGIYLSGIPEIGPAAIVGEPFDVDRSAARRHASLVERQRSQAARVLAAALGGALLAVYAVQGMRALSARRAVDALGDVTARAAGGTAGARGAGDVVGAEENAATALEATATPLWPPVSAAFRGTLAGAERDFLAHVRDLYLLGPARGGDRARRIRAFGVLHATRDDALGKMIDADPNAYGRALSMPSRVAGDYVHRSARRWQDPQGALRNLPPIVPAPGTDPLGRWKAFLDQLDLAFKNGNLDGARIDALRAQRDDLLRAIEQAEDAYALKEIVDALAKAGIDTRAAFGPAPVAPDVARWFQEHDADLRGLLDLIGAPRARGDAERPTDTARWGLRDQIELLQRLFPLAGADASKCAYKPPGSADAPDAGAGTPDAGPSDAGTPDAGDGGAPDGGAAPAPPPVYAFTLPDGSRSYRFERDAWTEVARKDGAGQYVRDFLADVEQSGRCMFFPTRSSCARLEPALLTRDGFEKWVLPALSVLDGCLATLDLTDDDRKRLQARATKDAEAYTTAYVAARGAYWDSFRLDADSTAALRGALVRMVSTPSWFSQFLETAADNANLSGLDSAYLSSMAAGIAPYRPLVAVMAKKAGAFPELDKYLAILAQVLPLLDAAPPLAQAGAPLAARLSPLGQTALGTASGDAASSYTAAQKWLDGEGLVGDLRKPFVRPVALAYTLGMREVEAALAAAWQYEIAPLPAAILRRYPFQRRATEDTSAADAAACFGPKGAFWTLFQAELAPAATQGPDGKWRPRQGPLGAVVFPAGALDMANDLGVLRAQLWTDDGAPRPLAFVAKALPMARVADGEAATMGVLQAGKSSVFAFNQNPDWQPFPVAWGTGQGASVSIRISSSGGDDRYRSIDGGSGDFAFHHLLDRADPLGGTSPPTTFVWTFPSEKPGQRPQQIRFAFRTDPWAPFLVRHKQR